MTPEGRVKKDVKSLLAELGVHPFVDVAQGKFPAAVGTYYMPVAGPMSVHGVHDFVGCYHGLFWSIETKAPENKEDATVHQEMFRLAVSSCGGFSAVGVRSASDAAALFRLMDERLRCKT